VSIPARPRLAASSLLVALSASLVVGSGCGPDAPPRDPQAPAPSPPATGVPVTPGDVASPTSIRLPRTVLPRAYELKLSVDPSKDRFSGEVAIDVTISQQLRDIVLHGRDLAIKSVRVVAGGETIAATSTVRAAVGARDNRSELVVRTEKLLVPGKARLIFLYDAPFSTLDGLYKTKVGEESFAFTQMEPIDARRAFPSFDDPGLKATFAISLTVPKGFDARSNGKIVSRTSGPDGDTVVFAPTPPIPAYLVAMTVGPMEYAGDDAFGLVAQKGMTKLGTESVDAARKILADQAAYTGIPYAYGKLDLAALPNFGPGAMENVGLVTFRDEFLLLDADPPADIRRRMRGIVAHELAHQWFGDLVTMEWWDDLWLNEAFATWMGPKTCDAVFPGMNAVADRVLFEHRAADGDMLPSSRAVRPTITTEDAIHETGGWSAYLKGSVTLAMVESYIGEAKFRAGVQDYLKSHAHGNATMTDFSAALQKAAPESKVKAVLESFVTQPGIPLVSVTSSCDDAKKGATVFVEVKPLRLAGVAYPTAHLEPKWSVPVCIRIEGQDAPRCEVVETSTSFNLPRCPAWIHPDAGEVGYYRWKLDDVASKKLLDSASKLSPTERAGLVLQPWSLAQAGEGSMQAVVDALRAVKLRKDEPRIVVEAVVDVLRDLDRMLVDEASRRDFRALVQEVLGPVAIPVPKLPRTTAGDEQRQLRITLLSALVDLIDDDASRKKVDDARRAAVDPEFLAFDLRVGARRGDAKAAALSTEKGYQGAVTGKRPFERTAVQAALGSFKDPKTLRAALDLTLLPSFQPGEFRNVRAAAMRFPDTREVFIGWVTEKYEPLAKKLGGGGSLTSLIGRVCDEKELKRLEDFFGPRIATIEGGQRGYDEGRADARRCIAIKSRLAPQLKPLLAKKK
jgi:alanyl aminopeptidase